MKKVTKIAALFQILVLYCFIVSFYSTGILASGHTFQKDHRSATEEGFLPIAGVDLFTHTTKPENVVYSFNFALSCSLKNRLNDNGVRKDATELYLLNTSSKYLFFSRNTIERFLETDIIFPFHYFW